MALARSLAPRPRLLMLDEPLGALDRALRERLLTEIRTILKQLEITAVFVTHDQAEALAVSDRIAVMNAGRLEQVAPPETLYRSPVSRFTAQFLGFSNLLPGKVDPGGEVATALGAFSPPMRPAADGERVTLILRPEGARLADASPQAGRPMIRGRVTARRFTGQTYRVRVAAAGGTDLAFDLPNNAPPPPVGRSIGLEIDPASVVIIPGEG